MAWKIEIEKADGTVIDFTESGRVKVWDDALDADYVAERLHYRYAETENYARFSVIDVESGETYTDWEC